MPSLIIALPLLGAIISGLFCRKISHRASQNITSTLMVLSAIISYIVFYNVIFNKETYHIEILNWINSGSLKVNWAIMVDSLTAVMLIVVTTVSAIVHIYSIGYMHTDPNVPRFMSYLSLFTFFMLMLVTSDNLIQLFFGWEGVGLCSYLLIGFWYKKDSAGNASIKAFVVNRVGDLGFALGIFAIFVLFGSVNFDEIFSKVELLRNENFEIFGAQIHAITLICILLFIGCMGKSAQLGLHTWLPDAMEGPTPVSALIHAATMVTAGVFLIVRCSALFEYSPIALSIVTFVGAITAIFAATVAITQNDIKRVIAYSTCSQLGYMFFACGVSAYSAAVFHLMTHAFFKALLFLGAGSVIHALSDEQDLRKMGGVWKKIPKTYVLMWIGSLALVGIYPFAGFYSKDIILESAYASSSEFSNFAFILGIFAAFLTAFYSWRLLILAFHGKTRASDEVINKIHESPKVMLLPLYVLAIGSILAGLIGYNLGMVDHSLDFWGKSIFVLETNNPLEKAHHVSWVIKLLPLFIGFSGIYLAYNFYVKNTDIPSKIMQKFSSIYNFLLNKWYFDELYNYVFVNSAKFLGRIFWASDISIVDKFGPNGFAKVSKRCSVLVGKTQTGLIYNYSFVFLLGVVLLISWFIYTIQG